MGQTPAYFGHGDDVRKADSRHPIQQAPGNLLLALPAELQMLLDDIPRLVVVRDVKLYELVDLCVQLGTLLLGVGAAGQAPPWQQRRGNSCMHPKIQ